MKAMTKPEGGRIEAVRKPEGLMINELKDIYAVDVLMERVKKRRKISFMPPSMRPIGIERRRPNYSISVTRRCSIKLRNTI